MRLAPRRVPSHLLTEDRLNIPAIAPITATLSQMTDNVVKYKSFAASLLRNPNDPTELVNQFALLSDSGDKSKYRHYLHLAKRAWLAHPDNPSAASNYGHALERIGQFANALWHYENKVMPLASDFMPDLLHDMGVTARGLGKNELSIHYLDRAIALKPDTLFKRNRALAMLGAATEGKRSFVDALKAFEARREHSERKYREAKKLTVQQKLPGDAVHWEGQNLYNKTIVVYHEEGSGDFIQFCRFIPLLRRFSPAKMLLTGPQPELLELVAENIEVDGILPLHGDWNPKPDYVLGSMSLPWRVGVELSDVSGAAYFDAEPAKIPSRGEIDVGLVWRGNPAYSRDHIRSMPFEKFAPLFDMPQCAFYSLQAGPGAMEITNLGFDGFVADLQPFMRTWRDTARCIMALDVVVTVDTAVAHLAGALGKPVFILHTRGADWRWNRRSDRTLWYDSARNLFQIEQDHWEPLIEDVKCRLEEMVADGSRRHIELEDGERQSGLRAVAG